MKKILVVDDDYLSKNLLSRIFKGSFIVEGASNGKEAIEKFRRENYDIVFLDIMMPLMTGMEVLKKIREYEKEKKVIESEKSVIIIVTALGEIENIETAYEMGCDLYLKKPITIKNLREKLGELGIELKKI
ncbi:response regulator [Haliovirga abyssi]|uniref:Response regulatory domain-containing protein n=1 Tax=Haliovirga abyssi TaxID=2996794 RepID=A0AAU9DE82_9FUSO|nr:response regulator [Haliovirga abyssi]BDU49627.1 hypothetical protein HLVA_01960 [Haliovirga abyssi]